MDLQGQTTITGEQSEKSEQLSFLRLINVSLDRLSTLKEGRKMAKEALDSELKQSTEFVAVTDKARIETANKKAVLKRLDQNPNVRDIRERIKDFDAQIKEEKQALGTTGLAYVKDTGVNVIDRNGVLFAISLTAKFTRANKKK